jgi:uncharacterized protein (DUF2236 family)
MSPSISAVGWKLQREIVLLLAWGPAILLQLAHPLVAQGIADHSTFRTQRHGRTQRLFHTIDAMLQLCFGTEAQAQATLARINAIHDRVNGHLAGTAGAFPRRHTVLPPTTQRCSRGSTPRCST